MNVQPRILPEEVAKLAHLARLGLNPSELEAIGRQINQIIAAVEKLAEADTASVDPTAQVGGLTSVMREDLAAPGLSRDEILSNAGLYEAGLLRVPAIQ